MKHFFLLTVTILVFSLSDLYAQDPSFTQFYASPTYLNPAFAGANGCPRFSLNYRNQWPNLTANFTTFAVAYDQYFNNISGGFGVLASHDKAGTGTIQTSMLGLIYSYHLKINREFSMMFGARASWYQKSLDWNKLTFNDMIDPRKGFVYQTGDVRRGGNRGFFDASAGFVGYSKTFFFGFATHHLNVPNESMIVGNSPLPMRFTAHAGADLKIGKRSRLSNISTSIMPNVIYQYQNGFQEINIGLYLKYGILTAGFWYRNADAFIMAIGVNTGVFRIGYSYDLTTSRLNNNASGGSHEISIGINLPCKKRIPQFKMLSCPAF